MIRRLRDWLFEAGGTERLPERVRDGRAPSIKPRSPELNHQVLVRITISAASCAVESAALRRPSRSTM